MPVPEDTPVVSKHLCYQTVRRDMYTFSVYGRETQLIKNDNFHAVRVVQTLVEPSNNKGYDLYVDRFYTSPLLASELTKVGITVTGTVQSNRRGMPKDVAAKRKREPLGNIYTARSGNILALS